MTQTDSTNLTRGYFSALASAAILSTTAIFIRYLDQVYQLPPLILAFWRDGFVTISLLGVLGLLRPLLLRTQRQHVRYLAVFGLVLAIFNTTWTFSVSLNGAAVSTVLVYSSAAFTALLDRCLFGERLDWARLLAIALSLSGCALVCGALDAALWRANLLGALIGLLSGLCFAAYSLMGRAAAQRGLAPWTTLFYTFCFATLFLLLLNLLPWPALPGAARRPADFLWLGDEWLGWGILLALAVGPTVLGFGLYNISLSRLSPSIVNLLATTEPVFTAALAFTLLGERLNAQQIGGGLLILAGVIFIRFYELGRLKARRKAMPNSFELGI